MKSRIFLVDDHPVMRRGYEFLIKREPDIEVCGEAGSAHEAIDRLASACPDLAIVDISLDGMSGLELIKQLKTLHPKLGILVVSMHDESLYAERALHAGAMGYVMKSEADQFVVAAIRSVLNGRVYLSPAMSHQVLMRFASRPQDMGQSSVGGLSDRELEIFELIGRGYTTAKIARMLVISSKTVETYRQRIKTKLGIDSAIDLVRRAANWVQSEEGTG